MSDTKVICLIGASGSGKTATARELEKVGYNVIQSYTTRPPREDGEWGHTFIEEYTISQRENNEFRFNFRRINSLGFVNIVSSKDMIAYFNSYESGHHYFATDGQVIRGKTNIYVVDAKGAEQVHQFYKDSDVEVITVYLQVDETERFRRMNLRGKENAKNGLMYEHIPEVRSRIESDRLLFQKVKCDYVVDGNQSLNKVVGLVENIIKNLDGGGERS